MKHYRDRALVGGYIAITKPESVFLSINIIYNVASSVLVTNFYHNATEGIYSNTIDTSPLHPLSVCVWERALT